MWTGCPPAWRAIKLPAVVLPDLDLPDSHGAETVRNFLGHASEVPVVVSFRYGG
jgi:hypothetical protein